MSSQEISAQSTAAADRDLIFVVIERHRELSAHYDAAASVSAKLEDRTEFAAADEISGQKNWLSRSMQMCSSAQRQPRSRALSL